jgi:DNA-directed RNA polymerase subunit RPC12/RpoP
MTFVTVKTFDNSMDAHMLKSRLENEGIRCFLIDDETVTMNPLFSQAIGGIKLKVDEKDVPEVKIILKEISETPLTDEEGEAIECPKCNSTKINTGFQSVPGWRGVVFALVGFFCSTFSPFIKSRYYCLNCENIFKRQQE